MSTEQTSSLAKKLKVLLTNDDGIHAPGILAMERALGELPDVEVWTVAPDRGCSASSHGMTLARPVFTEELGLRRIAVDGKPADCVYLAMFGLMESRPDVVVSGINHGANLGCDVIYSGTVAGAREGAARGVHGVAVSLVEGSDFEPVAASAAKIVVEIARCPKSRVLLLNLNYPGGQFKGPRMAPLGVRKYPEMVEQRVARLTQQTYYWLGGPPVEDTQIPGTDGGLIGSGIASATLLRLDQTDEPAMTEAETLTPFIDTPKEK
ncbi:MAG: 5'/3'-nucleotidase SurE [Deltaproteobacteria bacterium]|nr:5'/3'-nucleotidase SurE [Deltaproteobacteria bacterium]